MEKKGRTSIWVQPTLVLMMKSKGIDVSAFVNRAMAYFLGLPEDPNEVLIKKKTEEIVDKLRRDYNYEMRECIKVYSEKTSKLDAEKAKQNEHSAELLVLGDALQSLKNYNLIEWDLQQKGIDEDRFNVDLWEDIVEIVNSKTGKNYNSNALWNNSLDWYTVYGKTKSKRN